MELNTLCFDLYGTLVDIRTDEEQPAAYEALATCCRQMGAAWSAEELRPFYKRHCGLLDEVAASQSGYIEPDYAPVFAELLLSKGVIATPKRIAQAAWTFRRATTQKLCLYDGAAEFLRKAKAAGCCCVLVSNAQSLFTRPELKLLGLDKLLDCTFLSSEEGFKKPDKRFYQAALYKSGADPTRTLMVGNDARCDIEGAVEAGLRAAYFRTDISPASDPVRPQQASFAFKGADYDALAAALGI